MQDGSKIHHEHGRVIIDTANGPISTIDPVLLGNLTALLTAFAFAALIGLLTSDASRNGSRDDGPGAVGAPATLLLLGIFSLIFATFQSHLTAAVIGSGDPVRFAIQLLPMGGLASLGFIVAFLAVSWVFVAVNIFAPYARTARFIIQVFFLLAIWQWLGFTFGWVGFITGSKLLAATSFQPIVQAALTAIPFAVGIAVRFLLARLRRQDLADTQLAVIPAVAITGALVVLYLAAGLSVLWEMLWKPVFGVNLMRELDPGALWLICCLPNYLVLNMCQIVVPAIQHRKPAGSGKE